MVSILRNLMMGTYEASICLKMLKTVHIPTAIDTQVCSEHLHQASHNNTWHHKSDEHATCMNITQDGCAGSCLGFQLPVTSLLVVMRTPKCAPHAGCSILLKAVKAVDSAAAGAAAALLQLHAAPCAGDSQTSQV